MIDFFQDRDLICNQGKRKKWNEKEEPIWFKFKDFV